VRTELGLEGTTLLLYVGRLAPNKRLPVLVEVLARLRDRTPTMHALLIGDDTDLYAVEAERCRQHARDLGVSERLHILGHVAADRLRDAYRAADVFVMPSRHEGFCLPVLEAMACSLPVVAARAGALPETVGDAGLTFSPDDADDLARQILRVFSAPNDGTHPAPQCAPLRVAVVAWRYGEEFVGGAEASLRTIGESLAAVGHHVEVFTTCLQDEDRPAGLPDGTCTVNGMTVHRFQADRRDRFRHHAARQAIEQAGGPVPAEVERDFLVHSVHSASLLAALQQRVAELDAIVVGPYPVGLTDAVARAFPEKTLLLPCFHDEPTARLGGLRQAYQQVGGILYHSPEEQSLAEVDLGLNHPGAHCIGTWLPTDEVGDEKRGRKVVGTEGRYLVYCGRYCPDKNLPALLDQARRYAAERPERFTFVFLGQGGLAIPREPWARDLGFVNRQTQRDVLAGAAALLQPSRRESLSLVALEAWAQSVPLLADAGCAVLAGQLQRCGGGRAVAGYDGFAEALDDLWENPQGWRDLGRQSRQYVIDQYSSRDAFTERLTAAIRDLSSPLAERMRRRGLQRAVQHSRAAWRERFATLVENWLDEPARPWVERVELQPRGTERVAPAGAGTLLVPVRVVNRGSHVLVPDGPTRVVVSCRVLDATGQSLARDTPLSGLLMPGRALTVAVVAPAPAAPGNYRLRMRAERPTARTGTGLPEEDSLPARFGAILSEEVEVRLTVGAPQSGGTSGTSALLQEARTALTAAETLQRLPDDYLDVTQGWFARWKHQVKHKLLNNFKRAYVDVLSRQQSAFNRQVLTALHELAESCAALDPAPSHAALLAQLSETQRRCAALEERLAQLEAQKSEEKVTS
jgi:glycosyltransferase involved in cell wall biosynthesis